MFSSGRLLANNDKDRQQHDLLSQYKDPEPKLSHK